MASLFRHPRSHPPPPGRCHGALGAFSAPTRLDIAADGFEFRRGEGCGDCRGTGYKGRRAIAEILTLSDELREMVVEKRPIRQIKELAWAQGTRSLREAALALARSGETTLAEIKRVTQHA